METISEFDQLEPAQKAEAIRLAMAELAKWHSGAPKYVALIFFEQLASDVEDGQTPRPLTRDDLDDKLAERFPNQTTPPAVEAAPTRVAKSLEKFVYRYPTNEPRWELRFRGPTLSGRKGNRARSSELHLTYEANPISPEDASAISRKGPGITASLPQTGAITDDSQSDKAPTPSNRSWSKRRLILIIALAFVLLASALVAVKLLWLRPEAPPENPERTAVSQPPLRKSITVLSFRNNSGLAEDAWLSLALSEILSRALAAGRHFRVVPKGEALRMERELHLLESNTISLETLQRIRKRTRADWLVAGSFSVPRGASPALAEIEFRLFDLKTGAVLITRPITGTETELVQTAFQIAELIREGLGSVELAPKEKEEVKALVPSDARALRLYTEGVTQLRHFRAKSARDLLMQAAAADKESPAIQYALFEACDVLGLEAQARQAIDAAYKMTLSKSRYSDHLPSETKKQIAAEFYKYLTRFDTTTSQRDKNWQQAIDEERWLWLRNKDALEYGVTLTQTLISANRLNEALMAVSELRRPSALAGDGQIDLVEARAYQELGRLDKQLLLATSAAAKGDAVDDCVLVGAAQMLRATALLDSRDLLTANEAIKAARACFQAIGDLSDDARAVEQTAAAVGIGGDIDLEQALLREALNVHRRLGDRRDIARVAVRMANKFIREGKDAEARNAFKEALDTFTAIGNPYYVGGVLNEEGAFMFDRGELRAAEERYAKAFSFFQAIPYFSGMATSLTNIGEILTCRGDLKDARKKHDESLRLNEAPPGGGQADKAGIAFDLVKIGDVLALQGDRIAARARYQKALDIQRCVTREPLDAALTEIALARLLIEDGNAAEGEQYVADAEQILRDGGAADYSLEALSLIAQVLLAQGRLKEAHTAAERAWQSVAPSKDRRLRFAVALPRARVLAAADRRNAEKALQFLDGLRSEAARTGYVVAELNMGLAMGEIEVSAGLANGRNRLAAVKQVAEAKKIHYIALRAAGTRSANVTRPPIKSDHVGVMTSTCQ